MFSCLWLFAPLKCSNEVIYWYTIYIYTKNVDISTLPITLREKPSKLLKATQLLNVSTRSWTYFCQIYSSHTNSPYALLPVELTSSLFIWCPVFSMLGLNTVFTAVSPTIQLQCKAVQSMVCEHALYFSTSAFCLCYPLTSKIIFPFYVCSSILIFWMLLSVISKLSFPSSTF